MKVTLLYLPKHCSWVTRECNRAGLGAVFDRVLYEDPGEVGVLGSAPHRGVATVLPMGTKRWIAALPRLAMIGSVVYLPVLYVPGEAPVRGEVREVRVEPLWQWERNLVLADGAPIVSPKPSPVPVPVREPATVAGRDGVGAASTPVDVIAPADAKCPMWWPLAAETGWASEDLVQLDKVLWRESRCRPEVWNREDPNGGSRGLLQINGFWTRWLQERSAIFDVEDLYQPANNLMAGLLIYLYGVERYGFGWGPWGFSAEAAAQ